jgi:hypothetical protein
MIYRRNFKICPEHARYRKKLEIFHNCYKNRCLGYVPRNRHLGNDKYYPIFICFLRHSICQDRFLDSHSNYGPNETYHVSCQA